MKISWVIISVLLICACATGYQREGFTGGFSETQLDENVFRVIFKGNGYTQQDRANDFVLLRSADLALENGYKYFIIIDSSTSTQNSTYTTPTTYNTNANVYSSGNYAYGTATTTSTGGQTYNISKPSSTNTIVCFKEKPEQGFSYNAAFIQKSLKRKYGLSKDGPKPINHAYPAF